MLEYLRPQKDIRIMNTHYSGDELHRKELENELMEMWLHERTRVYHSPVWSAYPGPSAPRQRMVLETPCPEMPHVPSAAASDGVYFSVVDRRAHVLWYPAPLSAWPWSGFPPFDLSASLRGQPQRGAGWVAHVTGCNTHA